MVASRKKYYYRPLTTADKKTLWNTAGVLDGNGKLTAETSAVEHNEESTWFEINYGQIEEAKLVAATVAESGAQYNAFPLKLTGSAENITISVPDSGKTAYIILENAQLVGTISSVNGNA